MIFKISLSFEGGMLKMLGDILNIQIPLNEFSNSDNFNSFFYDQISRPIKSNIIR